MFSRLSLDISLILKITVRLYNECCTLYLRRKEECRRLRVTNFGTREGCIPKIALPFCPDFPQGTSHSVPEKARNQNCTCIRLIGRWNSERVVSDGEASRFVDVLKIALINGHVRACQHFTRIIVLSGCSYCTLLQIILIYDHTIAWGCGRCARCRAAGIPCLRLCRWLWAWKGRPFSCSIHGFVKDVVGSAHPDGDADVKMRIHVGRLSATGWYVEQR